MMNYLPQHAFCSLGRRNPWRVWGAAFILLLVAPLISFHTWAEDRLMYKKGEFHEENGDLSVTVGFRELFDKEMQNRLRNGFATTVVMRIYLYENGGDKPIAVSARTLKAVYDLWDEQYLVRIDEPQHTQNVRLRDQKVVIDWLTSFWHFKLLPLTQIKPKQNYFMAVMVEVNPMSEELLDEVRRWLRTPYNQYQRGSGGSFFGSFVSIFVNDKIRRAEKSFRFRTQMFFRRT